MGMKVEHGCVSHGHSATNWQQELSHTTDFEIGWSWGMDVPIEGPVVTSWQQEV